MHSKTAFTDSTTLITTLCGDGITVQDAPVFQNLTEPTAPDFAQARKFILSPTESYTVAVYSKEIYRGKKVLSCEDMPYHAKYVVIHEKDGHKQLTILKDNPRRAKNPVGGNPLTGFFIPIDLVIVYHVGQRANFVDFTGYHISMLEEAGRLHAHAHTRRGTCCNDRTCLERHAAVSQLGNDLCNRS